MVFYELLTGRRPFIAKAEDKDEARNELMDLIATTEARPPRQIDDTIPKELERICLKAMSKRATDRYTTARDMAEDLREFLNSEKQFDSDQRPIKVIVLKGLRSFDDQDAGFFLELLPGSRDRLHRWLFDEYLAPRLERAAAGLGRS